MKKLIPLVLIALVAGLVAPMFQTRSAMAQDGMGMTSLELGAFNQCRDGVEFSFDMEGASDGDLLLIAWASYGEDYGFAANWLLMDAGNVDSELAISHATLSEGSDTGFLMMLLTADMMEGLGMMAMDPSMMEGLSEEDMALMLGLIALAFSELPIVTMEGVVEDCAIATEPATSNFDMEGLGLDGDSLEMGQLGGLEALLPFLFLFLGGDGMMMPMPLMPQ